MHTKQYWLESILKKLYKKLYSRGKPRNYRKKKLNVSATNIMEGMILDSRISPVGTHLKRPLATASPVWWQRDSRISLQYCWKCSHFKGLLFLIRKSRRKYSNSPIQGHQLSSIQHSDLPGGNAEEGSILTLRSRVINHRESNKSDLPGDNAKEGFLRSEINSAGGQKALAQKIFLTIQKARMKRATDAIAKEVLGKRKAKRR